MTRHCDVIDDVRTKSNTYFESARDPLQISKTKYEKYQFLKNFKIRVTRMTSYGVKKYILSSSGHMHLVAKDKSYDMLKFDGDI